MNSTRLDWWDGDYNWASLSKPHTLCTVCAEYNYVSSGIIYYSSFHSTADGGARLDLWGKDTLEELPYLSALGCPLGGAMNSLLQEYRGLASKTRKMLLSCMGRC